MQYLTFPNLSPRDKGRLQILETLNSSENIVEIFRGVTLLILFFQQRLGINVSGVVSCVKGAESSEIISSFLIDTEWLSVPSLNERSYQDEFQRVSDTNSCHQLRELIFWWFLIRFKATLEGRSQLNIMVEEYLSQLEDEFSLLQKTECEYLTQWRIKIELGGQEINLAYNKMANYQSKFATKVIVMCLIVEVKKIINTIRVTVS